MPEPASTSLPPERDPVATYWDVEKPATDPPDLRQCGRCRQHFPTDPALHPTAKPEWWLCSPCHDALFADARA